MERYRHTQIGWAMIGPSLIVLVVILAALGPQPALLGILLVAIVLPALLFGALTVIVDDSRLSLRFGVGLIRKNFPLDSMRSFKAVRNPWYYGWGIRFTPVGRLYNVSGLSAVDVLLQNGRHVRVGTDEPDALVDALRGVIGEPPPLTVEEQRADASAVRTLRIVITAGALAIAAIVLGLLYVGTRPPSVTITPDMFTVRGGGFYSAEIPTRDILEVSLQDSIPRVVLKTNGFNAGNTLRGNFRLEVLGNGQIFINRGIPPYVVVRTPASFVIVNFTDPERTRALYAALRRQGTGR